MLYCLVCCLVFRRLREECAVLPSLLFRRLREESAVLPSMLFSV